MRMHRPLILPPLKPLARKPPLLRIPIDHIPHRISVTHTPNPIIPRKQMYRLTRNQRGQHLILLVPKVIIQIQQQRGSMSTPPLRSQHLPHERLIQRQHRRPQRNIPRDRILHRIIMHVVRGVRVDDHVGIRNLPRQQRVIPHGNSAFGIGPSQGQSVKVEEFDAAEELVEEGGDSAGPGAGSSTVLSGGGRDGIDVAYDSHGDGSSHDEYVELSR
mmetsp:Transcript_30000/g.62693  ORF Transcript_30000/g.62693 Transcript_30000/m.62693 type:complete len:216 (-) Transcript_30000:655-1302(-)